ncbi:MAG: FtsW/RodA/SpoVE family cell cycle protein [Fibromonadaceae bacterium]|jgi:cell division protein FtsW (lipid II flippase)|nr:FtsW/RodA/SpoVE family cell cycle protein [Fibromonadaceae bacterium]
MNLVFDYFHNLSERIRFGKWQLLLLPVLFSIIGIYIGISTLEKGAIPFKSFAVENLLLPLIFFAAGFLLPVSIWRRYVIRFSNGQGILWNKEGLSMASFLIIFAVILQVSAIWGDRAWDKIPITNKVNGTREYYTEAQVLAMESGVLNTSKKNAITQLRRQLSIFSRPFQVGEFVKIFLMIFAAKILTDMRAKKQFKLGREFFLFPVLTILPVGFFTFLMPNYSMLAIYSLIVFFMLFLQEMDFKPRLLLIVILTIPMLMASYVSNLESDSEVLDRHGVNRVRAFFHENESGNDQQNEALQALANGKIIGRGLDKGTIKHRLYGARNDFAYSVLGEELGLWLMLPITVAMAGFLFACFWVAARIEPVDKNEMLAQNIAWGIAIIFSLNVLLHIGVNLRLLPATGQPLSFVSAGGANLIMNFFLMGMLVQISSLIKEKT